jgi:transposase-like protein
MNCPKCKSDSFFKNGIIRNEQRFCCKLCSFNFTGTTDLDKPHPDSKPPEARKLANKLYLKGNGFRDIKDIIENTFSIKVNLNSIIKWVKKKPLD